MWKPWLPALVAMGLLSTQAAADPVTITFSNTAPQSVVSLQLQLDPPVADQAPLSPLTEPLATGESAPITLTVSQDSCLYQLTVTFADGKTTERNGLDLCEASTIIID